MSTVFLIVTAQLGNGPGGIDIQPYLEITGGIAAIVAIAVGIRTLIHQTWQERRNRRVLNEKFSRGPYDKGTIERSTRYYIRPKCSEIDPAQKMEPRDVVTERHDDLFGVVDEFLDGDDSHRHLWVLGDTGTGKTSFVLNYYAHNARRSNRKRHCLALVPLGIKNSEELIRDVPDQVETTIFLDAFDEDVEARNNQHNRFGELMEICCLFRRVVITCRTQFFPRGEDIPVRTPIGRFGPRALREKSTYIFSKLYLSPFDNNDVRRYIRKRFPIWRFHSRRKAYEIAAAIPFLVPRPMLISYIPDLAQANIRVSSMCQLYETMVDAWLERETDWDDKDALREFSERLAMDVYLNRRERGTEAVALGELQELARDWRIGLHPLQVSGRSLLNRDSQDNYKFSHRSMMEYLFAVRAVKGDERCHGAILTDQMKRFAAELIFQGAGVYASNSMPGKDQEHTLRDSLVEFSSKVELIVENRDLILGSTFMPSWEDILGNLIIDNPKALIRYREALRFQATAISQKKEAQVDIDDYYFDDACFDCSYGFEDSPRIDKSDLDQVAEYVLCPWRRHSLRVRHEFKCSIEPFSLKTIAFLWSYNRKVRNSQIYPQTASLDTWVLAVDPRYEPDGLY